MKTDSLPFFDPADIEEASAYSGKEYRKSDHAMRIGRRIFDGISRKTKLWAQSVVVEGYEAYPSMLWQVMGRYMKYSWARIYKPRDKGKGIYFTVGVSFSREVLEYKLDCQRRVPDRNAKTRIELTPDQIQLFDELVQGSGAEGYEIDISEIDHLDWSSLVRETEDFVRQYDSLYERAIELVWGKPHTAKHGGKLTLYDSNAYSPPKKRKRKFTFKPRKVDHSEKSERMKQIGDLGEKKVLAMEKDRLRKAGRRDLAKRVKHISKDLGDGAGHDILSFEVKGTKRFIEVKSTLGALQKGFKVTLRELQFSKEQAPRFCLYRVFELNEREGTGQVCITRGAIDNNFTMEPALYEATVRRS